MNDMNESQSASQTRYQRAVQPVPPVQAEVKNSITEPVREDLEQETGVKPPPNLARRPVPFSPAAKAETDLSPAKTLKPPASYRQTSPLTTPAAGDTPRASAAVPRSAGARFEAPAQRAPQPERTSPAQRSAVNPTVPAPAPVSLPAGIQRGFPRTPSPANGNGRPAKPPQAAVVRPAVNEVPREPVEPKLETLSEGDPGAFRPLGEVLEEKDPRSQSAPFLEDVLGRLAVPPAQTAILGVCDDGLPVLLDLNDPAPGAILVVSDDDLLRLRLFHTLLQTTALLNSPRSVQFLILSARPEEWQNWMAGREISRHCLGVERLPDHGQETNVDGSPERWLVKLAGWADQRRSGVVTGPAVILLVDDLNAATALEYDARVNFDWLVKEGPAVRIWPVVGLRTASAKELTRWVRLFKTRLLGPADDSAVFTQLSGDSQAAVGPAQFAVHVAERWLKFRVPLLPEEVC